MDIEEYVGQVWHRLVTRWARRDYPDAAIELEQIDKYAGIMFRGLGGDAGLRIEAVTADAHGARRRWLQRMAGSHARVELAWCDAETLRLPQRIAVYPTPALNRDLYLWLAALSAAPVTEEPWFARNQHATQFILARYPGLLPRYRRLVDAEIAQRPDLSSLPEDEATCERAIRTALRSPGQVLLMPPARRPPWPVNLWLHPDPPFSSSVDSAREDGAAASGSRSERDRRRRKAQRASLPDGRAAMMIFRFDGLQTWAESIKLDRATDDEDDEAAARGAADDLDVMSVARDSTAVASRVRFDLDLPAAANDDTPLGEGLLLPEWDYRTRSLRKDYCRVQPMIATQASPCVLPAHLGKTARRLRRQFESLIPGRTWVKACTEGAEPDLDAYLRHASDRLQRRVIAEPQLYQDYRRGKRDLACLLLADLSLSTDAWVGNHGRVIDVIRDSLFLFAEALNATGDQFALYGFSSRRRDHVRFHHLKGFGERYSAEVRGRIQAIKPGFYTRMGAAIRHATDLLAPQHAGQRLLLLLTDGKPNDLDQYEGRYGIEDTREALFAARRRGLQAFCITIDDEAEDYLPHVFGAGHYLMIRNPLELPRALPLLYARLTS